jgi:predicted O-methyltransferase YrrM
MPADRPAFVARALHRAAGAFRRAARIPVTCAGVLGMVSKDPEALRMARWRFGRLPRVPLTEVFPGIEHVGVALLRAFDRRVDTSLDLQEILTLAAVVRYVDAGHVLEIGTSDGNTALNLAANTGDRSRITTVDLPPDWNGRLALAVPSVMVNVTARDRVGAQFRSTPYAGKIVQVFGDSATLDWSRLNPPFDVAFLDGCHARAYVERDTANALRNLRAGGVLIWHDYGVTRDVSIVVDRVARRVPVHAIRGTRLAVALCPAGSDAVRDG